MNFIKVGTQYVNMDHVQHIEPSAVPGMNTLFLYAEDYTIRITDEDEQTAVLTWLDRHSEDTQARMNAVEDALEQARELCEALGAAEWYEPKQAEVILEALINLRWPLLREALAAVS